ncbi:MAG: hypothetical protein PHF11_03540, partial [Candidatus Omnitrophica bacterium]|nr:hypothetical protein [Candidatus Omnitrophota bacterium]
MPRKILSLVLSFTLLFSQAGMAQTIGELNLSGYLGALHRTPVDKLRLPQLRYFSYDNLNNQFRILVDKGDVKGLEGQKLQESSRKLLSYFLIGVTLPNDCFWVNLRPDSPNDIIDGFLAQTDVGKVLLEADLQLKKDTAQFTSPQTPEGKQYWDKLYRKAGELFGAENITIPTLTRPWIVPGEVIIRQDQGSAYVYKATLKVLLEQDYLKGSAAYNFSDPRLKVLNEYSSQLIRELIIPKLNKEVNSAKRYASLRQVYHSIILARWFKGRFAGESGLYASLIDKKNLNGLMSANDWSKTAYFKEYQKSFKNGEYNLQVPVSSLGGQSIRTYFSGGIDLKGSSPITNGFSGRLDFLSLLGVKPAFASLVGEPGPALLPANLKVEEIKGPGITAGLANKKISSPVTSLGIQESLEKLAGFNKRIAKFYDLTYDMALTQDPRLARVGFDLSDKKEPNRLGWTLANLHWLFHHVQTVENVLKDAETIRQNYKYVIFCGMGGSGLSVQAVKDIFGEKKVKIYSLRTTDPQVIKDILDEIATQELSLEVALKKTLVIPISKSGKTKETIEHKTYFENLFAKYSINVKDHMWVITDKGSPFDTGDYKQREIQLNGKGDIGGRFTAPTTNIFLLPLAIVAPERVWEILAIARNINDDIQETNQDQFMQLAAFLYNMAFREGKDKVTMIMPEALKSFPLWAEQLVEESLGKDGKGITVFYGEKISPAELKPVNANDRVFLRINIGKGKTNQRLWDYLVREGYPVFEIN